MHFSVMLQLSALLALLWLPWITVCAQQAGPENTAVTGSVYFIEPGSGRKVRRYWIELPFKDDTTRPFRIPCECPHILAELEFDEAARDTVIDRGIWQKVAADCRYMRYLTRHGGTMIIDHVSAFDFENASLDSFPLDPDCELGAKTRSGVCNPFEIDRRGMLRYFPLGQARQAETKAGNEQTCTLRGGVFKGVLWQTPGGVRCFDTDPVQGIRLTGVDFADVNGDGVLDAVLRLRTLGPVSGRQRLRLPLTRSSPEADFTTPTPAVDDGVLP